MSAVRLNEGEDADTFPFTVARRDGKVKARTVFFSFESVLPFVAASGKNFRNISILR
jgi:hypothetical protein